ncbi:hypothetical protein PFAG_04663 [Plasmodium falciparum Santa Lucia]|uniref:Uncharacterized protein n=2 Tax=Plasmodium falciparum TaxID=5833 RepID=W7FYU8_PLAFA|nr:hypothetical protein PFNF135_00360 [Plasmodium falciparum NF135/5.C10]EUT80023.1 hypothetical protein PFAG_04663 [Plasmodium falciparum Santa Lucia]
MNNEYRIEEKNYYFSFIIFNTQRKSGCLLPFKEGGGKKKKKGKIKYYNNEKLYYRKCKERYYHHMLYI